jgi:hypothetical protein
MASQENPVRYPVFSGDPSLARGDRTLRWRVSVAAPR